MRALRPLLLLLAAAAVGVAVGLLLLGRDDELPAPDAEGTAGATMLARTAVEPGVVLFAEPVTAQADFLVDPGRVDPGSVRVESRFDPFTVVAASRTQTRAGELVRVRFRYRLACAAAACVPPDTSAEVQLESGQVIYRRRALPEAGPALQSRDVVTWPAVEIVSRLGPVDVERARWRADIANLPEVTRRASPTTLGAAFLGGSLLLALLGAGLLATQFRPRRAATAVAVDERRATPLERALAGLVASSANGGGDDRRRALERLARELSATGRAELGSRARRLAWSPRPAAHGDVDLLAADVRAVLEEER